MKKFVVKRLFLSLLTIFCIITVTFFLMHAIPGDPFKKEGKTPPVVYENLRAKYGLDKPKITQYGIYLSKVVRFDFGDSMKSKTETVNQMIKRGFPVSMRLGLQALVVALVFGVILGVFAALYQNKFPDYLSMIIALIGISVPSFIMGQFLIQFVARNTALPISGFDSFAHTILPSVSLALMPLAQIARLMRSSMLEVLNQDYIKTARSKGIRKSTIIIGHAVKNAILPVVSILGTMISNLLAGSFVIEKIFGIPGLGKFFVDSIIQRDYTLIMGTTIFYSIILISMLLIVDIMYVFVDPRIKVAKEA
ncbi:MAG: ABC transporter permease [Bacillota bacterium]|nr:ABC transporter permease [Bacillota bacterium]